MIYFGWNVKVFVFIWYFLIGYRIGKGEGYVDMEYVMMVFMGVVN